jgi:hypothetical protein
VKPPKGIDLFAYLTNNYAEIIPQSTLFRGDMRNVSEAVIFGRSVEVVSGCEVIPLRIFYPILAI